MIINSNRIMTMNNLLLSNIKDIVGLTILAVKYIQSDFHYDLNGNWDKIHPDTFMLHGKSWVLTLSDNQDYYLSNNSNEISISINPKEGELTDVPNDFYWPDLIGKEITAFKLWQRVLKSHTFFGLAKHSEYLNKVNIVQFGLDNMTLCFSTMNGDIGDLTFYPTSNLADSLGIFFNKQIAESHTVHQLKMDMELTYDSTK